MPEVHSSARSPHAPDCETADRAHGGRSAGTSQALRCPMFTAGDAADASDAAWSGDCFGPDAVVCRLLRQAPLPCVVPGRPSATARTAWWPVGMGEQPVERSSARSCAASAQVPSQKVLEVPADSRVPSQSVTAPRCLKCRGDSSRGKTVSPVAGLLTCRRPEPAPGFAGPSTSDRLRKKTPPRFADRAVSADERESIAGGICTDAGDADHASTGTGSWFGSAAGSALDVRVPEPF